MVLKGELQVISMGMVILIFSEPTMEVKAILLLNYGITRRIRSLEAMPAVYFDNAGNNC